MRNADMKLKNVLKVISFLAFMIMSIELLTLWQYSGLTGHFTSNGVYYFWLPSIPYFLFWLLVGFLAAKGYRLVLLIGILGLPLYVPTILVNLNNFPYEFFRSDNFAPTTLAIFQLVLLIFIVLGLCLWGMSYIDNKKIKS